MRSDTYVLHANRRRSPACISRFVRSPRASESAPILIPPRSPRPMQAPPFPPAHAPAPAPARAPPASGGKEVPPPGGKESASGVGRKGAAGKEVPPPPTPVPVPPLPLAPRILRRPSLLACSRSPGSGAQTDARPPPCPLQNLPPLPDGAGAAAAPCSIPPQVRPAAASPPPPPTLPNPTPNAAQRGASRRGRDGCGAAVGGGAAAGGKPPGGREGGAPGPRGQISRHWRWRPQAGLHGLLNRRSGPEPSAGRVRPIRS